MFQKIVIVNNPSERTCYSCAECVFSRKTVKSLLKHKNLSGHFSEGMTNIDKGDMKIMNAETIDGNGFLLFFKACHICLLSMQDWYLENSQNVWSDHLSDPCCGVAPGHLMVEGLPSIVDRIPRGSLGLTVDLSAAQLSSFNFSKGNSLDKSAIIFNL